jgi:hypothetical protein
VEHDVVALGDRPHELDALARVLGGHAVEVVDEGLLAVSDVWVVLGVSLARISLDRFCRTAVVEHEVVERHHVPLVGLQICHTQSQHRNAARNAGPDAPRRTSPIPHAMLGDARFSPRRTRPTDSAGRPIEYESITKPRPPPG